MIYKPPYLLSSKSNQTLLKHFPHMFVKFGTSLALAGLAGAIQLNIMDVMSSVMEAAMEMATGNDHDHGEEEHDHHGSGYSYEMNGAEWGLEYPLCDAGTQ